MKLTWHGIRTMAQQEFVLRIRAGRWRVLLGVWFALLGAFTLLGHWGANRSAPEALNKGVVVYGSLALFVLALALLVVPSLTGQSVNGDRERGTLATLQVTRLSAAEIAVGKLAAAWGTALVFLGLSLPWVVYSLALGGVPFGRVLVVLLVMALLLGIVAAVGLCLSSLLSRSTTSSVLSYLAVFVLCIGTLIAFGIGTAINTEHYTQTIPADVRCPPVEELRRQGVPEQELQNMLEQCLAQPTSYESTRVRTDKVWWLLAPNPFVILADAAPTLPRETAQERRERERLEQQGIYRSDLRQSDPLGAMGRSVRGLRQPPNSKDATDRPVWPYGLAFDVLLGVGAVALTARRLHAPARELPKGQRVA